MYLEHKYFVLELSVKQLQLSSLGLKAGDFLLLSREQRSQLTHAVVTLYQPSQQSYDAVTWLESTATAALAK